MKDNKAVEDFYKDLERFVKPITTISKIDNIVLDGIDYKDAPDFVDAYIVSADRDGVELTEDEINELNEDSDFVYECVMEYIY